MVFLFGVNTVLYGGPFDTGYVGHFDLFKLEYFGETIRHFAYWLCEDLSPWVLLGFLVSVFWFRKFGITLWVLWLWSVPMITLYSFYAHSSDDWWFLRFILPCFPALIIASVLVWQQMCIRLAKKFRWSVLSDVAALAMMLAVWLWQHESGKYLYQTRHRSEWEYMQFKEWAMENLDDNDLIVAMQLSGTAYYYLPNALLRYDWVKPEDWRRVVEEAAVKGFDVYAPLFQFEWKEQDVLNQRIPGEWKIEASFDDFHLYRLSVLESLDLWDEYWARP
ncbi:MAG: hypothetical protein AAGB46_02250 [Verrucomicrobiota bacterium]